MKGQTLIEVLVALGIITVVITALSSAVVLSLGNARYSKDQNLATQFAQEGLEIVRQIRDRNYSAFRSISTGNYCLPKGASQLQPDCNAQNVDKFLRKVYLRTDGCAANVTSIEVIVKWQDSKCPSTSPFCHASKMSTCLNAVNPLQTL